MAVHVEKSPASVVGSPEWLAGVTKFVSWRLKDAEADCRPAVRHLPDLRAHVGEARWEAFCRASLDLDPGWVSKVEEGVAILDQRGVRAKVRATDAVGRAEARDQARTLGAAPEHRPPPRHAGPGRGKRNAGNNVTCVFDTVDGAAPPSPALVRARAREAVGNSAAYLLGRLKRDAPEHAEKWVAGEHRSVRAAAIAAGIVKPATPLSRALAAVKAMDSLADLEAVAKAAEARALELQGIDPTTGECR